MLRFWVIALSLFLIAQAARLDMSPETAFWLRGELLRVITDEAAWRYRVWAQGM